MFTIAGKSFTSRLIVGTGKYPSHAVMKQCHEESGTQLVTVLTRRPFDGPRHVKEMRELLGAEWTYMERVNKLGLVGCLPLLLTLMLVFIGRWSWLTVAVPITLLCWLPYIVLKRGARFRAAERRSTEHERSKPHYVITLTATPEKDVSGGFLRV